LEALIEFLSHIELFNESLPVVSGSHLGAAFEQHLFQLGGDDLAQNLEIELVVGAALEVD
jgi:hypothetical protein